MDCGLECPAETQTGIAVEASVELVSADFGLCLIFGAGYTCLVGSVGGNHVSHAEIDFSTEVESFVYIEVDAGGEIDVEAIAGSGIVPCPVVIAGLALVAGEVMDIAYFATSIKVDTLVVVEVALIADVELEAAAVVLGEDVVVVGVGHFLVVVAAEAKLDDESIIVGEEVAALKHSHAERFACALEGSELDFSGEITCLGSETLFSVCAHCAT